MLAALLLIVPLGANADEREDLEKLRATVLSLIDTLVKNHILPREKADEMMREAESRANSKLAQSPPAEIGPDGKKIVRVPYVPEAVKVQMRDEIKADVLAETHNELLGLASVNEASRIQWEGDFRLRAEPVRLDKSNTPASSYGSNQNLTRAGDIWLTNGNINPNFSPQENATYTRLSGRLGAKANVSDTMSAGLALSTGSTTTFPVSTSQTMGEGFNRYTVDLNLAYLKYDPVSWLSMSGGRFSNPYLGTDLIWADDLKFEGFALSLKPRQTPTDNLFFTAGWFPISAGWFPFSLSNTKATPNRSLAAVQGGFDWQLGPKENRFKLGAALYNYIGMQGEAQTTQDFLSGSPEYLSSEYATGFRQHGNTLFRINAPNSGPNPDNNTNWGLASAFRELDLTGRVDIGQFDPIHVVLTGDLVKNLAFNRNQIQNRICANNITGSCQAVTDGGSFGFLGRILVGAPTTTKRGDWSVSMEYRYLGSDAVLDAFNNPDFGLGGTNNKGTILGMNYGVDKNAWVSARWMSSDLVDSMVPATSTASAPTKFSVDVIQVDLNTKF
ncbi:MAG: putative porin [Gallionellaceae bacterium]